MAKCHPLKWFVMSSNFSSVKLTAGFVDQARQEADLLNRSLGGQIEHWARLGRALESSPGFSMTRVRQALSGTLKLEILTPEEQDAVFEGLGVTLAAPNAAVASAYAALGATPGAVGDDAAGQLVRRSDDGKVERV